jgi:acyl carrier protein
VVSLVGKFEDEFDIEVPDRKIKLMKTVDDIVKFIEAATEE